MSLHKFRLNQFQLLLGPQEPGLWPRDTLLELDLPQQYQLLLVLQVQVFIFFFFIIFKDSLDITCAHCFLWLLLPNTGLFIHPTNVYYILCFSGYHILGHNTDWLILILENQVVLLLRQIDQQVWPFKDRSGPEIWVYIVKTSAFSEVAEKARKVQVGRILPKFQFSLSNIRYLASVMRP